MPPFAVLKNRTFNLLTVRRTPSGARKTITTCTVQWPPRRRAAATAWVFAISSSLTRVSTATLNQTQKCTFLAIRQRLQPESNAKLNAPRHPVLHCITSAAGTATAMASTRWRSAFSLTLVRAFTLRSLNAGSSRADLSSCRPRIAQAATPFLKIQLQPLADAYFYSSSCRYQAATSISALVFDSAEEMCSVFSGAGSLASSCCT